MRARASFRNRLTPNALANFHTPLYFYFKYNNSNKLNKIWTTGRRNNLRSGDHFDIQIFKMYLFRIFQINFLWALLNSLVNFLFRQTFLKFSFDRIGYIFKTTVQLFIFFGKNAPKCRRTGFKVSFIRKFESWLN